MSREIEKKKRAYYHAQLREQRRAQKAWIRNTIAAFTAGCLGVIGFGILPAVSSTVASSLLTPEVASAEPLVDSIEEAPAASPIIQAPSSLPHSSDKDKQTGEFTDKEKEDINKIIGNNKKLPTVVQDLRSSGFFPVAITSFKPVKAAQFDDLINHRLISTPQFDTKVSGSRIVYLYVTENTDVQDALRKYTALPKQVEAIKKLGYVVTMRNTASYEDGKPEENVAKYAIDVAKETEINRHENKVAVYVKPIRSEKEIAAEKAAAEQKRKEEEARKQKEEAEKKKAEEEKARQEAEAKKKAAEEEARKQAEAAAAAEAERQRQAEIERQQAAAQAEAERQQQLQAEREAQQQAQQSQGKSYYKNCRDVWNTLGHGIQRGDPGYSSKLDRDGDGFACEVEPNY